MSSHKEVSEALEEINYQSLYTKGLYKLHTELEQKYIFNNISCISYALAANIGCLNANSFSLDNKFIYYLLADWNKVLKEFHGL